MRLVEELDVCSEWNVALSDQHNRLERLDDWLLEEERHSRILPPRGMRLNAIRQTPLSAVKVVITGQDPYPGLEGDIPHAMGLSFSVPRGIKPPRSLNNIYKELGEEFGLIKPDHGDLSAWARQGVLLLNSTLTLRQGEAASHAKMGWEAFTAAVLAAVDRQPQPVVFLAWGKHSHKQAEAIDASRHMIIRTSHPSPLRARKAGKDFDAFLGSRCFSRANTFLSEMGRETVNWCDLGD